MAALWVGISRNSLWSDLTSCQERHPAIVQEKPGSLHAGGIILRFCLYWLYPIDANTHVYPHTHNRTRTYESSFISWLSVLAIFLGGAGLSPSACSCSLFFAAFCLTHRNQQNQPRSLSTRQWQKHRWTAALQHVIIWDLIKIPYKDFWISGVGPQLILGPANSISIFPFLHYTQHLLRFLH